MLANKSELKAHKFVLDARSKNWDSQDLSLISELDLSGKYSFYIIWFYKDLLIKIK